MSVSICVRYSGRKTVPALNLYSSGPERKPIISTQPAIKMTRLGTEYYSTGGKLGSGKASRKNGSWRKNTNLARQRKRENVPGREQVTKTRNSMVYVHRHALCVNCKQGELKVWVHGCDRGRWTYPSPLPGRLAFLDKLGLYLACS